MDRTGKKELIVFLGGIKMQLEHSKGFSQHTDMPLLGVGLQAGIFAVIAVTEKRISILCGAGRRNIFLAPAENASFSPLNSQLIRFYVQSHRN